MSDNFESRTVEIPLTKGYVAIVDEIDADLANFKWYAATSKSSRTVYAMRKKSAHDNGIGTSLHGEILGRMIGRTLIKGELVDHINHNGLDNRRRNLRLATSQQNKMNVLKRRHNTSGYTGVSWHEGAKKWLAYIGVDKRLKNLGVYADILDAARAYNEAALKYFGEFASLNDVPPAPEGHNPRPHTLPRNNTSGFRGVGWSKKLEKWVAKIGYQGKEIHLGVFANILDAARAYNEAALKYFGDKAILNNIPSEE